MSWYVRTAEREIGPLSEEALRAIAATGQIGTDALVCRSGTTEWTTAEAAGLMLFAPESAPFQPSILEAAKQPIESPARQSNDNPDPETVARPWRRFWARLLDLLLGGALIGLTVGALRPSLIAEHAVLLNLLIIPGALLIDSLVYTAFGTTPGKAVAGIRVVDDRSDQRLTFRVYFKRNFEVYIFGLGLGIPIISLITLIVSYGRIAHGELSTWDLSAESRVIARSTSWVRTWIVATIYLALFAALMLSETYDRENAAKRASDTRQVEMRKRSEQQLQGMAGAINKDGARMVRPDTRFDDARAGPGLLFTYDYSMTNLRRSELNAQELEQFEDGEHKRLFTAACRGRLAYMLGIATTLRAHYLDRDGSDLGTAEVTRADCR
jgi:uncharacterized RDD family membrane protein YckC